MLKIFQLLATSFSTKVPQSSVSHRLTSKSASLGSDNCKIKLPSQQPCPALPCPTLPRPALPRCPALLYPTLPYLALT